MSSTPDIMSYAYIDTKEELKERQKLDDELWERAKTVAKKELREDEETKEHALRHLREWINKNTDIENCRTDDGFLLRFLRTKKFSLPMAEQMILKYINLRQKMSNYCCNLDYLSPSINELINDGFVFASPNRDAKGRRVVFTIMKNFNPYKYTSVDMAKIHAITYETLLDDEKTQIFGFTHIGDGDGASAAHVTLWNFTDFATLFKWGEQSYPMRHKEVHIVHLLPAFKFVVDFARTRVSSKMKDRLSLHNDWASLAKKVDPNVLPKEYGGKIPMATMIEMFKMELDSKRERLLALDKMKLLSDRGIICRRNKSYHSTPNAEQFGISSLPGSFRRLQVD
ncbi:retinaldehyde-binding protein 1-like [Chrysoperla carnea]|uniref:retinaldehyde-binding protein 1-like n=1 Tax=Chrysoperla carnea TaxID=189513 RepID=UPI001D093B7C|nr:retinaldehyde-binding protein 1-like [Chrysoperla carnea]